MKYEIIGEPMPVVVCDLEANEAMMGTADVIVTDGFTGNVMLKTMEGVGKFLLKSLKEMFLSSTKTKLAAGLVKGDLGQMKKLLDEKALGTILQSSFFSAQLLDTWGTENWRRQKEMSCGGALIDSGHHLIYQMLYLLGVPARLQAFTANLRLQDLDGEDTAQLNMQMTDGSLCVITESWASEAADQLNGIRILGTDGEMHLTDALYVNGERLCDAEPYDQTFVNQAQAFLDCLDGTGKPLSTLEDSEHTLQIIRAAYRSSAEGSVYRTKWHK